MQALRSGFPMELIAVDIAGPFPVSTKGNMYILVIQDCFSKWVRDFWEGALGPFALENVGILTEIGKISSVIFI